jgi:hypothetical protein
MHFYVKKQKNYKTGGAPMYNLVMLTHHSWMLTHRWFGNS